eukprot:3490653-Rhodomonas_salina.2
MGSPPTPAVTRSCVTVEWRRMHVCQRDRGSVWRRHVQRERGSVRKTESGVPFGCRRTSPLARSELRKRRRHWRSSWAEGLGGGESRSRKRKRVATPLPYLSPSPPPSSCLALSSPPLLPTLNQVCATLRLSTVA